MGIKLTRMLKETDIEDTSRFYADSAKYVPYFQKMFGVTDCTEELYKNFRPDITAAIRSGGCMGMFEDGVMIAAVLAVDWYKYQQEYPTLFAHMFLPELETTEQMVKYCANLGGPVMFVFATLVRDNKRAQGNMTKLLKKFAKQFGSQANIVSDCVYDYASTTWLKNGFKVEQLSDELQLAVKEVQVMSTVEGRFNQQPEDFILDEFHFACLSLQEDDTDE